MGLFSLRQRREDRRQQELNRQFEEYQGSLKREFDRLIRSIRIGRALVEAYNLENDLHISLEEVRFSLAYMVDTAEPIIEVILNDVVLCPVRYSELYNYMPDKCLTVHEKDFLKRSADELKT